MDVILARLDPRQLRVYCSDALQQELAKTFELLEQALAASKRAEEVQRASHKLAVQEFQDDSALLHKLEQIDSLRMQLSISIDHIVRGAKGKLPNQHSPQHAVKSEHGAGISMQSSILEHNGDSSSGPEAMDVDRSNGSNSVNVIDLIAAEKAPEASPTASRKRKLSISSTTDQQPTPSSSSSTPKKYVPAFEQIPSDSRLGKSIQVALDYSADVMKRKVGDRFQGFAVLASKMAVVVKNLEGAKEGEVTEAMDAMNHLTAIVVSVLVKAKPHVKRQVAMKALKSIQELQSKFPDSAALFEKSHASLSKHIDLTFPLSAKETEELKRRVRTTLKEVKAWESGTYSVPDFQEKMRILKQVLDSNCESFNPKKDPTVMELLEMLIARLSGFKESQKQDKRKETLLAWRSEMKVAKSAKAPKAKTVKEKKKTVVAASSSKTPSSAATTAAASSSSKDKIKPTDNAASSATSTPAKLSTASKASAGAAPAVKSQGSVAASAAWDAYMSTVASAAKPMQKSPGSQLAEKPSKKK